MAGAAGPGLGLGADMSCHDYPENRVHKSDLDKTNEWWHMHLEMERGLAAARLAQARETIAELEERGRKLERVLAEMGELIDAIGGNR